MSLSPDSSADPIQITLEQRVRYVECDPMGVAHHSVYVVWFEQARTELLRQTGLAYAELERQGIFIVVARLNLSYHKPARYDDIVRIQARLIRSAGARIEHEYEVRRGDELLCTGSSTLACVDGEGRVLPVPEDLRREG